MHFVKKSNHTDTQAHIDAHTTHVHTYLSITASTPPYSRMYLCVKLAKVSRHTSLYFQKMSSFLCLLEFVYSLHARVLLRHTLLYIYINVSNVYICSIYTRGELPTRRLTVTRNASKCAARLCLTKKKSSHGTTRTLCTQTKYC